MFGIRLAVSMLLTVAFLPTLAAAQYSNDAGQYVILSAQYGTERNHVDVTNRLKELAQRDRVFRMGNSTFGVDPDRLRRYCCPYGRRDLAGRVLADD